jgi:hypothetical protein
MLDSCVFCPPACERTAVEELVELKEKRIIDAFSAALQTDEEVSRIRTMPQHIRNLFSTVDVFLCPDVNTKQEKLTYSEIKNILFSHKPNLSDSDKNDVLILFSAIKHRPYCFVTVNKKDFKRDGIPERIWRDYKVRIVSPSECLKAIRQFESDC